MLVTSIPQDAWEQLAELLDGRKKDIDKVLARLSAEGT
jgi:hypothetical protein